MKLFNYYCITTIAASNITREEIQTINAMLGAREEIKKLYAILEAGRTRDVHKSKSAAANFSRGDIKKLCANLRESDDFLRKGSKEEKNRCPLYEGETGFCGKPCVGPCCFKHMLMGLAGHNPPLLEDYSRVKTNAKGEQNLKRS